MLPRDIREESGQDCRYQLIQFPGFVKGGKPLIAGSPSIPSVHLAKRENKNCESVPHGERKKEDVGFIMIYPLNPLISSTMSSTHEMSACIFCESIETIESSSHLRG